MLKSRYGIERLSKKDRIVSSCPNGDEVIDAEGLFAVPGFVDVHLHGALGTDFCDGTEDAIEKIAAYEASKGVLAICPATMTMEKERIKRALSCLSSYEGEGASVLGINLEGPFINNTNGEQKRLHIFQKNFFSRKTCIITPFRAADV